MDEWQRAMLRDLVSDRAGIINEDHAAPRLAETAAGLDASVVAWKGPDTHEVGQNGTSYARVQGPTTYVEFAPKRPGGDLTQHVHTIYRDLPNGCRWAFVPHPDGASRKT